MRLIDVKIYEKELSNIVEALPPLINHLQGSSVDEGYLGASLFYCYYAKYTKDESYFELAEQYLNKASQLLDPKLFIKRYATDSFDSVISSYGRFYIFATTHGFLDISLNEYLSNLDGVMVNLMESKIKSGDLSVWTGALASGHYLHHRLKTKNSFRSNLSKLIEGIEYWSLKDGDGDIYWKSPALKNNVYFGISHGSSMIISFLVAMYEQGIQREKCVKLIRKGINFILKHQRNQENGLFPIILDDVVESKQFSQCYGDLGVAYGLFRASQVLNDIELDSRLKIVMDDCLNRTRQNSFIMDAGMVYGVSGLAAVFDKLFRLSNNPQYDSAQNYWYMQIPQFGKLENGLAGYESGVKEAPMSMKVSFSWGIIGIGISLMKLIKKDLPPLDGLTMLI